MALANDSSISTPIFIDTSNQQLTIRPPDIWVADLLFSRPNRSLLYTEDGNPLILAEMFDWAELCPRLIRSLGWLAVHVDAILLNFVLLVLSFRKTKRQAYHKKVQFLLGSLAICNIGLALGMFAYTFLVDVYYHVDSFDTLLALNSGPESAASGLWHFAKLLIHTELVENLLTVQQLVLLLASVDRYLTLFQRYSPHAKHRWTLVGISALPFLGGLVLFDRHVLSSSWAPTMGVVNLIRLLALLCPLCLSLVFCACSIFGLLQQRRMLQRIFGALFRDELSLSLTLFGIMCLDSVAKVGLMLQLLGTTFSIRIAVGGQPEEEAALQAFLAGYFALAHFLVQLAPLVQALLCLLGTSFYRRRLRRLLGRLCCCQRQCCRRLTVNRTRLDYSSETMRSIIADQTRARQLGGVRRGWGDKTATATVSASTTGPPRRK